MLDLDVVVGWWVLDCDRLPGWPWPGLTWATSVTGGGWAGRESDRTELEVGWREMELPADSYIMLLHNTYYRELQASMWYQESQLHNKQKALQQKQYEYGARGVIRLKHTHAAHTRHCIEKSNASFSPPWTPLAQRIA